MERKHTGLEDPFKMWKENVMTDSLYQARNNYKQESFWPQFDQSDPFALEKFAKFRNLAEGLEQLSKMELHYLLGRIFNLLRSK